MSQEKVDKYKQEKYNRKNIKKKLDIQKYLSYAIITLVALAFVVYIGYSIGRQAGWIDAPTTQGATLSQDELESLRENITLETATEATTEATTEAAK